MQLLKPIRQTLILLLLPWLTFCDNRKDAVAKLNVAPRAGFIIKIGLDEKVVGTITDSLKIHAKGFDHIPFTVIFEDENANIESIRVLSSSIHSKITYRGQEINGVLPLTSSTMLMSYKDTVEEKAIVKFIVTDRLGDTASSTLHVYSFFNLPPVGSLKVSPLRLQDPYEYELDASESYDQDRNYGGIIKQYIYTVEGVEIRSSEHKIKHIFGGPGTYTIELRVIDNDEASSEPIRKQIVVPSS